MPLDGADILDDIPSSLPSLLPDDHDVHIHAPPFHPVLSIHDSMYYSPFPDCIPFSQALAPAYSHQHPDLNFAFHNDPNDPFVHDSPHVSPKHAGPRAASSLHDSRFNPLAYLPPLNDLVDHSYPISSSPPKLAHTLLPPIVLSNPAELGGPDSEASVQIVLSLYNSPALQTRSATKRNVSTSPSQVDPCAAPFLRDHLGEAKWNTFSARLFERRLGPIKSKIRVRAKNANEDSSPAPGATVIDFLVKVEVVKEVLRTYVPHPYNPLKSLAHPYPHSPLGSVTLTRSTILVLSGWSNTQFSYWARRAEGISVLAAHDERLHAVALALQKRINAGGVLLDGADEICSSKACPNVTGKGLDIIIEDVKKRTGHSPFLRGKHSSLDPFGSTNSDKDAGPGPPQGVPAAPIYMPTFQAMEYTHAPAITASAESPIGRRPKKKRRISVADSVSSYCSSTALNVDCSDEQTNLYNLSLADNPRLTPDQESVSSADMQPISPPSTISLPQLLDPARVDDELSPYELSSHGMHLADDGRPEYFPVSNSRSDLDHSDSENFPRKRYYGLSKRNLEKRQLSA